MRKWQTACLLMMVLLVFLLPSSAGAQGGVTLESLFIELLPEYDDPSMLVIQRFRLPSESQFPLELTLHIPASARVHAVAYEQDGELYYVPSAWLASEDDLQLVTLTIEQPFEYRLEYYLPLERLETTRNFTYQWTGDYAVQHTSVSLKLPDDATDVITSPNLTSEGSLFEGALQADEPLTLQIEYQRASNAVQTYNQPVEPAQPLQETIQWPERMLAFWPWALGILGVVLIVGGGLYYWFSGRGKKPMTRKRRVNAGGNIHCHQCGQRAQPGDRFCRTCGTRLRQEA